MPIQSAIDISREGKWNERLISYGGRAGVLPVNDVPIKRNAPLRETSRDAVKHKNRILETDNCVRSFFLREMPEIKCEK